jgi:hypothetical protein
VKRLIAETARECSSEAQKVQHKEDLAILSGQHARECRKPDRTNGSHAGRPTVLDRFPRLEESKPLWRTSWASTHSQSLSGQCVCSAPVYV